MKRKKRIYALYKGETYLFDGTIQQIANRLGISPNTVRYYGAPVYKRRTKDDGNAYRLVFVCEE